MITLAPSVVLGDRYRLESRIAGGGMGEVWAARDLVLERLVAVKVLRPEFAEDPSFRTRFLAEARHSALLSHAGIAGVFDFGEADGTPYLVMELVEGETLAALLARTGALPIGQALSIVGQAGLALQAAHDAGVVHRDVKPGNLIVRPDGVVKVTDFGIARALAGASVTMTGNVLGTVHYIAPEQARGERVTPASDTYALGVVAWECLEGRRPFAYDSPIAVATAHASEPLPALSDRVPPEVRALIASATDKNPALRPTTAGDFGRRALALAAGIADGTVLPGHSPDAAHTVLMALPVPAERASERASERTRVLPALPPPAPAAIPFAAAAAAPRRNRGGLIRLIFVAVIVAAIIAVALFAHSGPSAPAKTPSTPTPTPTSTSSHAAPSTSADVAISLDRGAYVGRPYEEVAAALSLVGLTPRRQDTSNTAAPDTVVDIGNGPFHRNDAVTVTVSTGPVVTATTGDQAPGESGQLDKTKKGKD